MRNILMRLIVAVVPAIVLVLGALIFHSLFLKKRIWRKRLAASIFAGYIQAARIRCPHM